MANTYTPNLNLAKPAKSDVDWDDELNGNSDILDAAVGAEHSTDGKHKNTINVGDGANTDKKIVAHTGETNEPYIAYDASEDRFVTADDGVNEHKVGRYITRANTIFVATDGNDTDGDGTLENPYATISKAVTEASANAAIIIFHGTYSQGAVELTVNKAVHIIPLGTRGGVIISGTPSTNGIVLNITGNAQVENLTVRATGGNAGICPLRIGATDVKCRRLNVENQGTSTGVVGLKVEASSGVLVEDCDVSANNGYPLQIDIPSSTGPVFRRCRFISSDNIAVHSVDADCDNVTFEQCEIESGGADGDYGINFAAAVTGWVIRYCTIKGETTGGGEESIHTAAAMTAAVYHCSLNAAIDTDITNSIATPYNVEDADI